MPTQRWPSWSQAPFSPKSDMEHWLSGMDARQFAEKPLHEALLHSKRNLSFKDFSFIHEGHKIYLGCFISFAKISPSCSFLIKYFRTFTLNSCNENISNCYACSVLCSVHFNVIHLPSHFCMPILSLLHPSFTFFSSSTLSFLHLPFLHYLFFSHFCVPFFSFSAFLCLPSFSTLFLPFSASPLFSSFSSLFYVPFHHSHFYISLLSLLFFVFCLFFDNWDECKKNTK